MAAVVDVGSNSVHLLVAALEGRELRPLADESVFLGLGDAVADRSALGPDLRAELVAALRRYAEAATVLGDPAPLLLATEPLRAAADAGLAVADCAAATGLELVVLTAAEEGLLTALGVTGGRPVARSTLVIDLGGGSTDCVLLDPAAGVAADWTIPTGSARLTRALRPDDPPAAGQLARLRELAEAALAGSPVPPAAELVFVGGTASNVLRVVRGVTAGPLRAGDVAAVLAVVAAERAAPLATRIGLNPRRAPLLPAGAALLAALLDRWPGAAARVSDASLREGAVLAHATAGDAWRARLAQLLGGAATGERGRA